MITPVADHPPLDAGGYEDTPGDEVAVDRECYAYLRANGCGVVFVAPITNPVNNPR